MMMGIEDADVITKASGTEKRDKENVEKEFQQNDLAF